MKEKASSIKEIHNTSTNRPRSGGKIVDKTQMSLHLFAVHF